MIYKKDNIPWLTGIYPRNKKFNIPISVKSYDYLKIKFFKLIWHNSTSFMVKTHHIAGIYAFTCRTLVFAWGPGPCFPHWTGPSPQVSIMLRPSSPMSALGEKKRAVERLTGIIFRVRGWVLEQLRSGPTGPNLRLRGGKSRLGVPKLFLLIF